MTMSALPPTFASKESVTMRPRKERNVKSQMIVRPTYSARQARVKKAPKRIPAKRTWIAAAGSSVEPGPVKTKGRRVTGARRRQIVKTASFAVKTANAAKAAKREIPARIIRVVWELLFVSTKLVKMRAMRVETAMRMMIVPEI